MRKKITCGGKPMTAVVLAGGRGTRMRAEKAGLAIAGTTLLGHVLGQITPYFEEVLVSVSRSQNIALPRGSRLRVAVVEDDTPGLGPIGGLLAGLKAARNDACMVIACDIPDVPLRLLRSLARAAEEGVIAVPVDPAGLHEPLFAVYRKSVIAEVEALVASGERSILPLYQKCRTAIVRMSSGNRLRNLNTRPDYEAYLASLAEGRGRRRRP